MLAIAEAPPIHDADARAAEDAVLVERCLSGDDAGWQLLITRYGGLVEAVIRRYHLPPDDQADVFQDVWVALWRDLPSLHSHARLGAWLVKVAGRLAWDARKRLPRLATSMSDTVIVERLVDEAADPAREAARRETSAKVQVALAQVSPRCRFLLQALFYDEAASYDEVASQLGCSPNSIGPIRGRCFSELRTAIEAATAKQTSRLDWESVQP